jgi:nitrogen regulatory protein PII
VVVVISAIVKTHRLDAVHEALADAGVTGMTVTEVKGFGRQGGHTEVYRGAEYRIDLVPKLRVEVLTGAEEADHLVEAICRAARTGAIGDGKIWVTRAVRSLRIRTGEAVLDAL